ncbi:MAG: LacI family DNA-binding transcriptional regulator [Ktedonobacteraceae bacterium]|nr:LacI family DNA-binding transcriptional regulator [Ktedonobacteraceae bacterium]
MIEHKRPRLRDVARLAGVSTATVSLVLNGRVSKGIQISQETRERVLRAVQELGYLVNPVARSLRGGQNRIMGVFIYSRFPMQDRAFYYLFLDGMEEEAAMQDYNLLLFTRAGSLGSERRIYHNGINHLQTTDGAILLGRGDRQEMARLVEEGYPFVFIGRREVPGHQLSYIEADYVGGAVQAIEHLVRLGHRKIAFLGYTDASAPASESSHDREVGYRLAHQRLGLPLDETLILHTCKDDITVELLKSLAGRGVTACVADDATLALAFSQVAQQIGQRIPQDCSLIALGDAAQTVTEGLAVLTHFATDLTTFVIPRREMGMQAVRLLSQILAHPDQRGPHRLTIPGTFSSGSTTGAPPS